MLEAEREAQQAAYQRDREVWLNAIGRAHALECVLETDGPTARLRIPYDRFPASDIAIPDYPAPAQAEKEGR